MRIINKIVGSITHWTFRLLISVVCEKLGVHISHKLEWRIAYTLTWIFLISIGIWTYVR